MLNSVQFWRLDHCKHSMINKSSSGSVSMEYIIVSCFSILISIAAISWLGKVVKNRMTLMTTKLHADPIDFNLDFDLDR